MRFAANTAHVHEPYLVGRLKEFHTDPCLTALAPVFLREVLGNPLRPVSVAADWLTSTVRDLAAGAYQDDAFDRLPILADALQDAGCDHDDLLSHLRGPDSHVRGCWALDLILGKE